MDGQPRHHCLVYEGPPSRHLAPLAGALCEKLKQNYRCLYLNSPAMVAGMKSCLAAKGLDVVAAMERGSLVLADGQDHLQDGKFDAAVMLRGLEEALAQALSDGYQGFWASGDMTWEFGPERNFSKLLEYERQLEAFFHTHPEMMGVCQYHADTLPREAMRVGLLAHRSVFINETLALVNPHYLAPQHAKPEIVAGPAKKHAEVESSLDKLLQLEFAI
jgi:hypothetical protein